MAKKSVNDHAQDHDEKHKHEGSSVAFYIFIALVLGVITYVEFALVEYSESWFAFLTPTSILIWLIVLSVVKFILVVMFFMHLQQDHRIFTGFFTSGMVIAVGTLFALSALFTVRSVTMAQTPQQEEVAGVHGEAHTETHAEAVDIDPEQTLAHRLEYPSPKTQDVSEIDLSPLDHQVGGLNFQLGTDTDEPAEGTASQNPAALADVTSDGLPRASDPPAIILLDPFSAEGQAQLEQAAAGGGAAATSGGDAEAGQALFTGQLGCAGCHAQDGSGGVGPDLTDSEWTYGGDAAAISETLYNGRPGGMPAFSAQASEEDIANVVAYVLSLSGGAATGSGAAAGNGGQ